MNHIFYLFFLIFSFNILFSQENESEHNINKSEDIPLILDTVFYNPKYRSYKVDKTYYYWLQKKIFKVYPFYVKALEEYNNIQLLNNQEKNNKKEIKNHIKKRQNELASQYEVQLKKLTKTEGRIFSKLLYRKTNKTTYQIIKELRGSWNAFWWDFKADLFGVDLEVIYQPQNSTEDLYIESIIKQGLKQGYFKFSDF